MELLPQWVPNLHPLLVHFPIAILFVAFIMDFLSFFLDKEWWSERATSLLYLVGAAFALLTYYSGGIAADSVHIPTEAEHVVGAHAGWAWWLIWFFGLYAIIRVILNLIYKAENPKVHTVMFILAIFGLFIVYETGEHGAELVYNYGIGTQKVEAQKSETPEMNLEPDTTSKGIPASTSFNIKSNGDWQWNIGKNAVSDLLDHFDWVQGSAQDLTPRVISDSAGHHVLELNSQGPKNMFVMSGEYKNLQLEMVADLQQFDGTVTIVYHVQDSADYNFTSINPDRTISIGRVDNNQKSVFESEHYKSAPSFDLRAVNQGDHFKAYVNDDLIVHTHHEPAAAGSAGLMISGKGTILIQQLSLTQLGPEEDED